MVTITDSGLRHSIYETVYDLINTDKSGYGASGTPTLYGGFPDLATITFPSIIITPIVVNETSYTIDTSRSTSTKDIQVVILCFAKSNKDLDYLSDGVSGTLRNNAFTGAFLNGVQEDNSEMYPAEQKIKVKTLTFNYVRR
jgi:hypothetical protein